MNRPLKIFFVCTGLGNVSRGFESFTRECYEAFKDDPEFEFLLVKGGGQNTTSEKVIPNLQRNGSIAKMLGKLFRKDGYFFEQLTFFISSIPTLLRFKPDVIFYSDFILGTYYWHFRKRTGQKYKLLFSNGAPNGPPFTCTDHVQQLLNYHLQIALKGGEDPSHHEVVPYGLTLKQNGSFPDPTTIKAIRKQLGLPENKKIILSVGAINSHHKRMDYLIEEFSKIDRTGLMLVMLGQETEDTPNIKKLAANLLRPEEYLIKTVPQEQVHLYYDVSDYFVLASLSEGLPRVILEASAAGLQVICHDYGINSETLGAFATYVNMAKPGALSEVLTKVIGEAPTAEDKQARRDYIYKNYSWDTLKPRYAALIRHSIIPHK